MNTVTIPKSEYKKLKRYSSAYLKIATEISEAEREFPYDYKYIGKLSQQARADYKKGEAIKARSVDEALKKSRKR